MTCPSLIEGTSFTFKNGRTFTVMQDISCKTKNLVYAIICSNCGEFYVGETKTELRTRMTVHRQQTRHQDLTIIRTNEHFHDCSGGHFKIFPLYKVNTEGVERICECSSAAFPWGNIDFIVEKTFNDLKNYNGQFKKNS